MIQEYKHDVQKLYTQLGTHISFRLFVNLLLSNKFDLFLEIKNYLSGYIYRSELILALA